MLRTLGSPSANPGVEIMNRNLTHLTPLLIDGSSSSASEPAELIVSQN